MQTSFSLGMTKKQNMGLVTQLVGVACKVTYMYPKVCFMCMFTSIGEITSAWLWIVHYNQLKNNQQIRNWATTEPTVNWTKSARFLVMMNNHLKNWQLMPLILGLFRPLFCRNFKSSSTWVNVDTFSRNYMYSFRVCESSHFFTQEMT